MGGVLAVSAPARAPAAQRCLQPLALWHGGPASRARLNYITHPAHAAAPGCCCCCCACPRAAGEGMGQSGSSGAVGRWARVQVHGRNPCKHKISPCLQLPPAICPPTPCCCCCSPTRTCSELLRSLVRAFPRLPSCLRKGCPLPLLRCCSSSAALLLLLPSLMTVGVAAGGGAPGLRRVVLLVDCLPLSPPPDAASTSPPLTAEPSSLPSRLCLSFLRNPIPPLKLRPQQHQLYATLPRLPPLHTPPTAAPPKQQRLALHWEWHVLPPSGGHTHTHSREAMP